MNIDNPEENANRNGQNGESLKDKVEDDFFLKEESFIM
jgi:hypothetical protein